MIGLSLLLAISLADGPVATPPQTGTAVAGPAGTEVIWARTWPEAVEMAKKKPDGRILVELMAEGCGECERQEALVLPATSFFRFMVDKVPVRIPISSQEGRQLAERWGIQGPPAWIVLTTDGLLCGIQAGPSNQPLWFDTFSKTEQAWGEYLRKLELERKNPADLTVVYDVAEETYRRGGNGLAEPRFRRLSTAPKASTRMKERSLAYLASIEMDDKRIPEAERDLNALLGISTDQMLRERAELRLADCEIAKGRRDLAVARLRQFRKDHPSSALVAEADELLKRLDPSGGDEAAKKP